MVLSKKFVFSKKYFVRCNLEKKKKNVQLFQEKVVRFFNIFFVKKINAIATTLNLKKKTFFEREKHAVFQFNRL